MQIVVFRSAGEGWSTNGSVFGRVHTSAANRAYMFNNSGTGFTTPAPATIQRQNAQAQTPGAGLAAIAQPMVAVFGHQANHLSLQWGIGREQTFSNALFIYEILAFSSILPVEDIEQIEAHLMDKYGISA